MEGFINKLCSIELTFCGDVLFCVSLTKSSLVNVDCMGTSTSLRFCCSFSTPLTNFNVLVEVQRFKLSFRGHPECLILLEDYFLFLVVLWTITQM